MDAAPGTTQFAGSSSSSLPPPVIALAGWLVPGLGYWLMGQRARGVIVGVTILLIFLFGILAAGIRVIDVPGYTDQGQQNVINGQWTLTAHPLAEIVNKPWYVGQIMAGPVTLVASKLSLDAAGEYPKTKARLGEIGTLYTAVAGMLNLLAIIDAASRASHAEAA